MRITMGLLRKKNSFMALVIFLISPLLSLAIAIKNHKSPWAKNILWLFVIFYSITFSIPSENSDAFVYKKDFEAMARKNITLYDFTSNLYTNSHNFNPKFRKPFDDVIQPLLSFGLSSITDNFRVLYLFVGIIFGYFYSRNIWFLLGMIKERVKPIHIFIILSFAVTIPFWSLNSIRMWTAAHIFFYGAIRYFDNRNWKSAAIYLVLSVLMHFSFLFPVSIFVAYFIFGNRTTLYFSLFLLTFFVNEIDLRIVRSTLTSVLPHFFHENVETFTPDVVRMKTNPMEERGWHAIYYALALKWSVFILIITMYVSGSRKIMEHKILSHIFAFTLFFLAFAQLGSLVPSGGRFLNVGYLFAFISLIYFLREYKEVKLVRRSFYLLIPGLLLFCLVSLRIGFEAINVGIFGNIFTIFFVGPIDIPINDLLR